MQNRERVKVCVLQTNFRCCVHSAFFRIHNSTIRKYDTSKLLCVLVCFFHFFIIWVLLLVAVVVVVLLLLAVLWLSFLFHLLRMKWQTSCGVIFLSSSTISIHCLGLFVKRSTNRCKICCNISKSMALNWKCILFF